MVLVAYLKKADPYSVRLKAFLDRAGFEYVEKWVDDDKVQSELSSLTDQKAPILVSNGVVIGDYEQVTSLDLRGELRDTLGL